ncbi:MAG: UDP-N-acetylmuramate--L-alanine ligase, partial [Nostocaceae cyanobacterium]|nr:UDP-N-acetylmuramate--L-alanine ligase [Nostocaceae cyanobacterium]
MPDCVEFNGRPFHFIGIGGIGMSALAYVLQARQLPVSGSDLKATHITRRLESLGAHIFAKQEALNLEYFLEHPCKDVASPANGAVVGTATGVLT